MHPSFAICLLPHLETNNASPPSRSLYNLVLNPNPPVASLRRRSKTARAAACDDELDPEICFVGARALSNPTVAQFPDKDNTEHFLHAMQQISLDTQSTDAYSLLQLDQSLQSVSESTSHLTSKLDKSGAIRYPSLKLPLFSSKKKQQQSHLNSQVSERSERPQPDSLKSKSEPSFPKLKPSTSLPEPKPYYHPSPLPTALLFTPSSQSSSFIPRFSSFTPVSDSYISPIERDTVKLRHELETCTTDIHILEPKHSSHSTASTTSAPTAKQQPLAFSRTVLKIRCPLLFGPGATFTPTTWLPNTHLQTSFVQLVKASTPAIPYIREIITLPDGAATSLDWYPKLPPQNSRDIDPTPILLLVHGLNGSSSEAYVRHLTLLATQSRNYRVVAMNLRGCGGNVLTTPRVFDGVGGCEDLEAVVLHLRRVHASRAKIIGVGWSLGANMILNYLGKNTTHSLTSAICLSPTFDLTQTLHHCSTQNHGFYSSAFALGIQMYLFQNWAALGSVHDPREVFGLNLRELAERFLRFREVNSSSSSSSSISIGVGGSCGAKRSESGSSLESGADSFGDVFCVDDRGGVRLGYYDDDDCGGEVEEDGGDDVFQQEVDAREERSSDKTDSAGMREESIGSSPNSSRGSSSADLGQLLNSGTAAIKSSITGINVPVLILSSRDDPITSPLWAPLGQISRNPNIVFATTAKGGHIGWFEKNINPTSWANRVALEWTDFVLQP